MIRLALLALAAMLAACGAEGAPAAELDGGALYLDHCEPCHGYDARGSDHGADLYWRAADMSVEEVADVITLGEGSMDPVDVDDQEAEATAAFLLDVLIAR